jgi:hypothetical protein
MRCDETHEAGIVALQVRERQCDPVVRVVGSLELVHHAHRDMGGYLIADVVECAY